MEEYVSKYGGVIHENSMQLMLAMMFRVFTSPEYSVQEAFNTFVLLKGREFTMQAMWQDIRNVNFTQEIQSINVPLYFFEGQYDMATPIEPVKTFYNAVTAENGKTLIMFENSAHFLMVEEKEKYQDALVNVVLKESMENWFQVWAQLFSDPSRGYSLCRFLQFIVEIFERLEHIW